MNITRLSANLWLAITLQSATLLVLATLVCDGIHSALQRWQHANWNWMRRLARLGPVLVLFTVSLTAAAADLRRTASDPKPVPVSITWAMADRFGPGYDRNHDGRPDLPNSYEYVNPGDYEVQFAACAPTIGAAEADMSWAWTIEGCDGAIRLRATGPRPMVRLPEGRYSVTVTVQLPDGRTGSALEAIRVRDFLIVALGDSLATGEGNPEEPADWTVAGAPAAGWMLRGRLDPPTPAQWANGGPDGDQPRVTPAGILPPSDVLHARAHRSTRSGPAQFAMRLEAADPHTSVTFVCLAATGTSTVDLFETDRSNHNKALGPGPPLPAQLDELHAIAGCRSVDVLVLGVGFNDARSIELLGELLRREIRCVDPLRLLDAYPTRTAWAAAATPDMNALVSPAELAVLERLDPDARREVLAQDVRLIYDFAEAAEAGLAAARERLEQLTKAIAKDPLLARAEVCVLEYPDPTHVASGATAEAILDDLVPGLRINRRELDLAREYLLRPLNRTLSEVADRQGWTHLDGIFESFRNHGYAAQDTWFVRAKESEQLQGPRLSAVGYLRGEIAPGVLHPNRRGHEVIADRLYQSVSAGKSRVHCR
jgi:lysophospholipase L1-like esterase